MYKILVEQFPNLLVFPNMALMTIFEYDRMKELVDSETFGYFLRSQVDFCITSNTTYMPLIGFEIDSPYHDNPSQQQRDAMKDRIFQLGGVPLLRLRPYGQPTEEAIRQQITGALRQLGEELANSARRSSIQANLLMEVDFSRFRREAAVDAAAAAAKEGPHEAIASTSLSDFYTEGNPTRDRGDGGEE